VRRHALLLSILAIAAVVRYWAIAFCLPGQLCRPDEEAVAAVAMGIFGRNFNPGFFDWPTLFMYVTAASLVPFFKLGVFLGWFRGEPHFARTLMTDASPVFLAARMLSATAGVVSVWVIFRVGRHLFGERTAIVAALFLALAFLHVRDSHFGVTDVPATCLVLVSFLFTLRFWHSDRWRDLILAAVTAGLATSTKYNAALIALPALWAVFRPRSAPTTFARQLGRSSVFAVIMVLAFGLTSPYCFIEFERWIAALRGISAHLADGHGVVVGRGWVVHLTSSLRYGLGLPLLVAGLAGLFLLAWKQPAQGILVALFPVACWALVGSGYTVFARYIVPAVPFLCLVAAYAVTEVSRTATALGGRPNLSHAASWALALLVVAPSAWSVVQFDRLLSREDSRVVAAQWVRARFPDGATIAQVGRRSTNLFFVPEGPTTPSRYKTMTLAEDSPPTAEPDILVVANSPLGYAPAIPPRAAALSVRYTPLSAIVAYDQSTRGVYDWQDEFYLPLAGFAGVSRPGPNLTLYVRPDIAGKVR